MGGLPFDVIYLDEVTSEKFRNKLLAEAANASSFRPNSRLDTIIVGASGWAYTGPGAQSAGELDGS